MLLAATFLAGLVLTALLTRVFLGWVEARDIAAEENHRTMHKGRVPTGGGWPLLAAALAAVLALWPPASDYGVLLPCLAALALVSWADDVRTVPPLLRLGVHLGATAAAIASIPGDLFIFQGVLPFWADRLLAGLALAWFINLYNFMDGIDGIAGVETVAITLGYAAVLFAIGKLDAPLLPLALAVAGASMGFLVWNWHPARIFLGDVGAVPLGFLTGWLMLDLAAHHSLAAALILPLYFAADATITITRRILRGEKPWEPHREHAYQRAARGLGSHAPVSGQIALANLVLIVCACVALTRPWLGLAAAALEIAFLLYSLDKAAAKAD